MAHFFARKHRLQRRFEAWERSIGSDRLHADEISGDEDVVAERRRNLDRSDPGMGDRAAQERHILHARQAKIADELSFSAEVTVVFLARQPRPDALTAHAR